MKRADSLLTLVVRLTFIGAALASTLIARQSQEVLAQYFEGKQVTVKMDMPGSQKGVDVYPDRPQPLDTKSYQDRLKAYGVSLRTGDQVMITKIKVKSDNVEFQLGGGGFGTAGDNTDTSVHFKPAEKTAHEKELEDQLSKETDDDRRRSLSRELDDIRRDRERLDRRNQRMAEDDAANRKEQVLEKRVQGGARFNIRFESKSAQSLTPQFVMAALAPYLEFGTNARPEGARSVATPATALTAAPPTNGSLGLQKGLTRAQVDALFGPAVESHDRTEGTLTTTTCTYETPSQRVLADFVSGVLIRYSVSSE